MKDNTRDHEDKPRMEVHEVDGETMLHLLALKESLSIIGTACMRRILAGGAKPITIDLIQEELNEFRKKREESEAFKGKKEEGP